MCFLTALGWSLEGPFAFVVLFMSQDLPDEYDLVLEIDLDDQAVLVPADVDNDESADSIGTGPNSLQFGKVGPSCLLGDPEPSPEWVLGIAVHFEEFTQPPKRDDMHAVLEVRSVL